MANLTEFLNPESISYRIWDSKYRYRHGDQILDADITASWDRVAKAIAQAEKHKDRNYWQKLFYGILENFKFLPGGRILAGAGTKHKVTLLNCFVMNIKDDSLRGIFQGLEEGALTLQQGGGVGYDFSILRPNGDLVKKTGIPASGPVSFMRIWDAMCSVLLSTGARRGAMMGVLRCDHPDIEEFIHAKKNPQELRHFNVSILVSDEFMQAVKNDAEWPLIFPTDEILPHDKIVYKRWANSHEAIPCKVYKYVYAKKLWESIIRSAYDYAEPGVLFHDTINRENTLGYKEQINATNPCGEIPLPIYGACDLGAVNLTQFVNSAFSPNASIDWLGIEDTVKIATRFLDNVLSVSKYPLKVQQKEAENTRRIGLGITGLADMMVMLNIRYGSEASIKLAAEIMQQIAEVTWQTSIDLAQEKGIFAAYHEDYLTGKFVSELPEQLRNQIRKYGIRNSHHNTIAPTGTISLLANNISNGIEPIFHAEYNRNVRMLNGVTETFNVKDYAYRLWCDNNPPHTYPNNWVATKNLSPLAHLEIQAAVQKYIDNAISKTINLPKEFPFSSVSEIYTKAYELGLKGCTIFRPNEITGSVLEIPEEHCCQFEDETR